MVKDSPAEYAYIPKKGDIVKLSFDPQAGHEQTGWRPGLVLSNYTFNKGTGFAVICPITNTERGYPFHLPLATDLPVTGVVMVEQLKSLDYRKRNIKYMVSVTSEFIENVAALSAAIFQDD